MHLCIHHSVLVICSYSRVPSLYLSWVASLLPDGAVGVLKLVPVADCGSSAATSTTRGLDMLVPRCNFDVASFVCDVCLCFVTGSLATAECFHSMASVAYNFLLHAGKLQAFILQRLSYHLRRVPYSRHSHLHRPIRQHPTPRHMYPGLGIKIIPHKPHLHLPIQLL
jgi:hypothetical protein